MKKIYILALILLIVVMVWALILKYYILFAFFALVYLGTSNDIIDKIVIDRYGNK